MSTTNPKPKAYQSALRKIGQKTKPGKGVSFPLSHAILERTSSENETTTDKVAERQYLNIDNKIKLAGQIAAQMNVTPKSIFKRVPGTKSPATTDGTYIYPEEEAEILQAAEESYDPKNLDGPFHSAKEAIEFLRASTQKA